MRQNVLITMLAVSITPTLLVAQTASADTMLNKLTPAEQAAGWRLLFDGRTTDGWRGFKLNSMPDGWKVVDGALTRVAAAGDILTTQKFKNFELTLEWKISEGGNSGIFYRGSEDE